MSDDKKKNLSTIDHDAIRQLAALLDETDLTEIEVEQSGLRLRVVRQLGQVGMTTVQAPAPQISAPIPAASAEPVASATNDLSNHPGLVSSPMVGTAYLSPQPGAPNFIKVGDTVTEGQTLMIVEAMKTMNPIAAPKAGRITQILVANEDPVEFGEPLAIIE